MRPAYILTRKCGPRKRIFALIFCLVTPVASAADEPEIKVATGAEEIFAGESVDYQVEIRNSKNPTPPDMSAIKQQFDVVAKGDQSRNQSSTYIINGRVTQETILSHIYLFQLTPRQSGALTIPPVTVTIDGKTLTGDKVSLRVIEPEEQDLVIAEIEVSHSRVYPTQPFSVTLRIFVKPLPNDDNRDPLTPLRRRPPHLQLNWGDVPSGLTAEKTMQWLQPLLSESGTGFSLNEFPAQSGSLFDSPQLAVFNLSRGRKSRKGLNGEQIRYYVYELERSFTPEKTDTYSIGPAVVKGTFVAEVERSEYQGKRLVTVAPAVPVEVREVPSPRPETYCGAIGHFKVSAAASPTTLRVGDPLTLTIELERGSQSGSLELISAPDLSSIPSLTDNFDLIDKNPTGRIEGSVKKFSYALRPRNSNASIPPLMISTFDPQAEQFQDIETAPIPLTVSNSVALAPGDLVGNRTSTSPRAMKSTAEGVFQNITDLSELRDQRVSVVFWGAAALAVWCVTGLLIAILKAFRRRSSDGVRVRRQQATRSANRRLAEARAAAASGQSIDALRHVRQAIVGLVADTRNRIAEGLTSADVDAALTESSVSQQDRSEVLQLLESIESAEYGASDSANTSLTIDRAETLISRIAPHLINLSIRT